MLKIFFCVLCCLPISKVFLFDQIQRHIIYLSSHRILNPNATLTLNMLGFNHKFMKLCLLLNNKAFK